MLGRCEQAREHCLVVHLRKHDAWRVSVPLETGYGEGVCRKVFALERDDARPQGISGTAAIRAPTSE
jgi:hypothetical protein